MIYITYITHALLSTYGLEQKRSFPPDFHLPVSSQTHPCQLLSSRGGLDQHLNQQEWRGVALIELMVRRASAYEVAGFWVDSGGGPTRKTVKDGFT